MNDNLEVEGPAHAAALGLINDLMLILSNAHESGLEKYDARGEGIFALNFWSDECAKVLGLSKTR